MTHEEKLLAAQTALMEANIEEARRLYQEILVDEPENLAVLDGMGILCCQNGNAGQAIEYLNRALDLLATTDPATAETEATLHLHLGLAFHAAGQRTEAMRSLLHALDRVPDQADALLNLGRLYFEMDRHDEAIDRFYALTACRPENASAWLTLGYILSLRERFREAIPALSEAVRLDAASPDACFYLAEALRKAERYEDSLPYYQRLLKVASEWPQAVLGLGKSLLALGSLEDGWDAFEFRFVSGLGSWERHRLPDWKGQSHEDQTILAYSEEGIAADLLFASCLPDLINTVDHCVIECETSLHTLFQRSFPRATIVPLTTETVGETKPDVSDTGRDRNPWGLALDGQVALGSLPGHFRRRHDDFPLRKAYLVPDRERVEQWSHRLAELGGAAKVGVLWQGGWTAETERQTAIPLSELRNLLLRHQSDAAWVCLQHGSKQKAIDALRRGVSMQIHLFQEAFQYDLDEMAALITALDLVVTPPGYVAHLAGALGVETWLVLPERADWRWKLGRPEALWHRSMKMYRRQTGQAWSDLFRTLDEDLRYFLATHRPPEEEAPPILTLPAARGLGMSRRKVA